MMAFSEAWPSAVSCCGGAEEFAAFCACARMWRDALTPCPHTSEIASTGRISSKYLKTCDCFIELLLARRRRTSSGRLQGWEQEIYHKTWQRVRFRDCWFLFAGNGNPSRTCAITPRQAVTPTADFTSSRNSCGTYESLKVGWEAWTRTRISRSRICCTANCTTSQHGKLRVKLRFCCHLRYASAYKLLHSHQRSRKL